MKFNAERSACAAADLGNSDALTICFEPIRELDTGRIAHRDDRGVAAVASGITMGRDWHPWAAFHHYNSSQPSEVVRLRLHAARTGLTLQWKMMSHRRSLMQRGL